MKKIICGALVVLFGVGLFFNTAFAGHPIPICGSLEIINYNHNGDPECIPGPICSPNNPGGCIPNPLICPQLTQEEQKRGCQKIFPPCAANNTSEICRCGATQCPNSQPPLCPDVNLGNDVYLDGERCRQIRGPAYGIVDSNGIRDCAIITQCIPAPEPTSMCDIVVKSLPKFLSSFLKDEFLRRAGCSPDVIDDIRKDEYVQQTNRICVPPSFKNADGICELPPPPSPSDPCPPPPGGLREGFKNVFNSRTRRCEIKNLGDIMPTGTNTPLPEGSSCTAGIGGSICEAGTSCQLKNGRQTCQPNPLPKGPAECGWNSAPSDCTWKSAPYPQCGTMEGKDGGDCQPDPVQVGSRSSNPRSLPSLQCPKQTPVKPGPGETTTTVLDHNGCKVIIVIPKQSPPQPPNNSLQNPPNAIDKLIGRSTKEVNTDWFDKVSQYNNCVNAKTKEKEDKLGYVPKNQTVYYDTTALHKQSEKECLDEINKNSPPTPPTTFIPPSSNPNVQKIDIGSIGAQPGIKVNPPPSTASKPWVAVPSIAQGFISKLPPAFLDFFKPKNPPQTETFQNPFVQPPQTQSPYTGPDWGGLTDGGDPFANSTITPPTEEERAILEPYNPFGPIDPEFYDLSVDYPGPYQQDPFLGQPENPLEYNNPYDEPIEVEFYSKEEGDYDPLEYNNPFINQSTSSNSSSTFSWLDWLLGRSN